MLNKFLFNLIKHTMFYQILIKGHGMIIIDKKYSLIKNKCLNKMFNHIHLVLIYGTILLLLALKDMMIVKGHFLKFTEPFFRKSKANKLKLML